MFQIVRTIFLKCHLVMPFFVFIIAFMILPNVNPAFSNTDTVKNHINQTNQSHLKLETNIAPIPKPDLILLLGGDLVEMKTSNTPIYRRGSPCVCFYTWWTISEGGQSFYKKRDKFNTK